ncbi:hypothetical protein SAMN04487969_11621 [Paenibacillus algorifonticola]|uniref:Uncharacterized protein n=1 Tax=Paenibacillus algorifonticola TaxID=684063 RepID=A0A1I2GFC5_9BACL|nr:hypothetical protein [Paenibacillus algorifonticola]SFF16504.1 hypothetical protein SAMN04487969_11621 [Paenibacillus algorifonticola]
MSSFETDNLKMTVSAGNDLLDITEIRNNVIQLLICLPEPI